MERRLDFKHLETSPKAPELFSRYLENPDFLPLALSKKQAPQNLSQELATLLNLQDALNEIWFSFSTKLTHKLEGLESFLNLTKPLEAQYIDLIEKLSSDIRQPFLYEYQTFQNIIEGIKQNSPDAMSAVSGHYLNFSKLIEMTITGLSLYGI